MRFPLVFLAELPLRLGRTAGGSSNHLFFVAKSLVSPKCDYI